MADNCPHCGAALPVVRDAFCPECRNELEAAPPTARRPVPADYQPPIGNPAPQRVGRQRPLGVGFLAIIYVLGGIGAGVMTIPLLAKIDQLEASLQTIGLPPALFVIGLGFLVLLAVTSGVGMWLGRKWGWWLAAFYSTYSIAQNATALLTVAEMADELASTVRGAGYYYLKHAMRIAVHLLILLYLFRGNVLHYFELDDLSKRSAMLTLIGVCLAIGGITSAVAWLAF